MSKVTHYSAGFGEKNGKICTIEVPILLVTVYIAPSNKENNYINTVLQSYETEFIWETKYSLIFQRTG